MKQITKEEYRRIKEEAEAAREILEDERFGFLMEFINGSARYVEETIVNNTIRDVKDVVTVSDKLKRIFFTPKKDQLLELTGQYKFINDLISQLKTKIEVKKDADELISKRQLKVKEPTEDVSG